MNGEKLFTDHFILFFCHDITQLSLSTYPSALSESTRKDIRNYFEITLKFTLKIQNEIVDLLLSKDIYLLIAFKEKWLEQPPQAAGRQV